MKIIQQIEMLQFLFLHGHVVFACGFQNRPPDGFLQPATLSKKRVEQQQRPF